MRLILYLLASLFRARLHAALRTLAADITGRLDNVPG